MSTDASDSETHSFLAHAFMHVAGQPDKQLGSQNVQLLRGIPLEHSLGRAFMPFERNSSDIENLRDYSVARAAEHLCPFSSVPIFTH